jgi:hypothetical protein
MMNRILKRPMFRMGGRSDDGIMSIRPKYQEGGDVGFFQGIINALNPTSGEIIERIQKVQEAPSLGEKLFSASDAPLEFRTQADADAYLEANPEFTRPIKILGTGEIINQKPTDTTGSTTDTTTNTTNNTTTTKEVSDEDTIKSYMKMFSDAFGESPEDASRERFLQLAKFGANLLGQPGGDLVGAVGRAAAPSIEGLAASEAARKAGDREVKLAAVKTAIEKMDDPTADKIKTLARIAGVPEAEVAKLMISGSGDSKMDRIELTAKAIEENVGSSAALKIAQALEEEGAVLAQASPIEIDKKTKKPKEGVADGYYYDDTGKLYKVEKGKPSIVKIK